jgi:hypothetical protein
MSVGCHKCFGRWVHKSVSISLITYEITDITRNLATGNVQPYHIIIVIQANRTLNSAIPWNVTQCSRVKVYRHFGGTYRLHLQGRKRNEHEGETSRAACCLGHAGLLLGLLFYSENNLPKRRLTFTGVHGVISQETNFSVTAVRTSNP